MLLNNTFVYEIGPLDQGFWPDGIYTAPTDEALKSDLLADKALGFNMVRKHIKVEPYRWYYWADKLGLLVWQDMPSPDSYPSYTVPAVDAAEFESELVRMIQTHWNSPCIIMWDVFNEAQGQQNTQALVDTVAALDQSRLVNEASGWQHFGYGSINDVHSYPAPACPASATQAAACGEFGGIGYQINGHVWTSGGGYQNVNNAADYLNLYNSFFDDLAYFKAYKGMSAAVYTQITDVEGELNGILTYDRAIYKADTAGLRIAAANLYTKKLTLTDVLATSQKQAQTWRYTFTAPAANWYATSFNDQPWNSGPGGFGTVGTPGAVIGTTWNTADIWLRRQFSLGALTATQLADLVFLVHHDEDCEIYLNGTLAASATGYTSDYTMMSMNQAGVKALVTGGANIIAVHCHQTTGGQFIDVGIVDKTLTDEPTATAVPTANAGNKHPQPAVLDSKGGIIIRYKMPRTGGFIKISVYNPEGRLVLEDQRGAQTGPGSVRCNLRGTGAGIYIVKIETFDCQGRALATTAGRAAMVAH
jgi:hypothetical protein